MFNQQHKHVFFRSKSHVITQQTLSVWCTLFASSTTIIASLFMKAVTSNIISCITCNLRLVCNPCCITTFLSCFFAKSCENDEFFFFFKKRDQTFFSMDTIFPSTTNTCLSHTSDTHQICKRQITCRGYVVGVLSTGFFYLLYISFIYHCLWQRNASWVRKD